MFLVRLFRCEARQPFSLKFLFGPILRPNPSFSGLLITR
nr:MAG TPA: hypothetical protein [Caudoviricetes sp.]